MIGTTKLTSELMQQLDAAERGSKTANVVNRIHVSELTSVPSFLYEKIRNIVDYKDEYLLRKNALRRFLKRTIVLPKFSHSPEAAAAALVRELILSRYLPNDTVPEQIVPTLAQIITKYFALFDKLGDSKCDVPKWKELLLGIAAVECDSHLVSPVERNAYISYAYKLLKPVLELPDALESDEAKSVQFILTIQRVLERSDREILMYYLLRHYYADWFTLPPTEAANMLAPQVPAILRTFTNILEYRLGKRLLTPIKKLLVPLLVFRDLLHNYQSSKRELLSNPNKLEELSRETYRTFWRATRKRVRRKGFHAIVYIFVTKMLLALLLELPYERIFLQDIHYLPLAINLLFPPFLMMVITLLIKSPGVANEASVVKGIREMIYGGEVSFYKTRKLRTATATFWKRFFYGLLYLITFGTSFGLLVSVLYKLEFNLLSGALFIFFISLVSFFGISLRQQARQLKVVEGRETITAFLVDFFTLPVVAFGKWLSNTFDKINVFVFFLDFLFEVPFKSLLKMIEDWFNFLKEKKDEMY